MTVTLTCSFCGQQETQGQPWRFPGWYMVIPQDLSREAKNVCSEECGASWLLRRQLERERVKT